jgi:hypothetical protein
LATNRIGRVGSFVSAARPFGSECSQIKDDLEHGSGSNEA